MINKEKIIKAEIYNSSGRLIISTKQIEFPKDFFSLEKTEFVVLKGNDIPELTMGDIVDAVFYYRNGTRVKYSTTVDLATDLQVNIHIGSQYVVMEERRRFYKTETEMIAYIKNITTGEGETEVCGEPIEVIIKNINIGGVFMVSPKREFKTGDTVLISIIDGKIDVVAEILRIQRNDESRIVGYGCKFNALSSSQEEKVSRYIFDCQIAQREKEKSGF